MQTESGSPFRSRPRIDPLFLQIRDNLKAIDVLDKMTDEVKKEIDDIVGELGWLERSW